MKIGGKKLNGPNVMTLVLPREGEDDIVIKAQAVLDMEDFESLCPEPIPPSIRMAGGEIVKDVKDETFLKKVKEHNERRYRYIILKSLEATPGLEWETVNLRQPETWENYFEEMKSAGFSNAERSRIELLVFDANALSEDRLKEARDRFLRSQQQDRARQSSLKEEPSNMESGAPANG